MRVESPKPQITYWADAIVARLPNAESKDFLAKMKTSQLSQDRSLYAKIVLWQLDDPIFGLRQFPAVRRDSLLAAFYKSLSNLYQKESAGELVPANEFESLYKKMESVWAVAGIQKKMKTGFIAYRFSWIGGKKIADYMVHGWREAWAWGLAASRKRGSGQTDVLVWTFARAEGEKNHPGYVKRMKALEEYFLENCLI